MHEISGLTVDLEDVMGSRAAQLASRCDEAPRPIDGYVPPCDG